MSYSKKTPLSTDEILKRQGQPHNDSSTDTQSIPIKKVAKTQPHSKDERFTLYHQLSRPVPWSVSSLVLMLVLGSLCFTLSFINWQVPALYGSVQLFPYTPFLSVMLAVCAFIGPRLALPYTTGYLTLGFLGLPLFAYGGGLSYLTEPSAAYLLALLPAGFVVSLVFRNWMRQRCSIITQLWRCFSLACIGTVIVHGLGMSYMAIVGLLAGMPTEFFTQAAWSLSLAPWPYDIAVLMAGLLLVRPARLLMWAILF